MQQDRILVTGAHGFLGKAVCDDLISYGFTDIIPLSGKSKWDLTKQKQADYLLSEFRPSYVVHLAARVGGIGANKDNPGLFMYENLAMGINLIESCRKYGKLKKFIMVGTVCEYPKFTTVPFKEGDLWNGYPEETNAPYGIAKKTLRELLVAYNKQYNFNSVNLVPVNMYGPYDNFDPKISHVIPALMLKIQEAIDGNKDSIVCWGTGNASREFLYVYDCAQAIRLSLEKEDIYSKPLNIGTGQETKIFDLVHLLSDLMGYKGKIEWDTSKPDAQPRRCLDISRSKEQLGYEPQISLEDGLKQTLEWWYDFRNRV